ncbi:MULTISPECIES: type III secretion system stator protein SctL [Pseudomonas]|nr:MULTISPECIES: type III secretion system stator protein SctL [Pseudomonas]
MPPLIQTGWTQAMLCHRKIKLHTSASSQPNTLISRQTLEESGQASSLLNRAKAQAEEQLRQAAQQSEVVLEEARLEFWRRALAQLQRWEHDRQAMCDALEHYATTVTNNAIRYLLDETPDPQRLAALLKHLLASQLPRAEAALLCNPAELNALTPLFAPPHETLWTIRADETVPPQTLVLKTDEGDFRIDWASMFSLLLAQHNKDAQSQAVFASDGYASQDAQ